MYFLEAVLLATTGLGLSLVTVAALITAHRLYFRKFQGTPAGSFPAVSVFKPLKGADDGLEENLRSFFQLDYPQFELLSAVRNPHDPAVAIVERLQQAYPEVRSRLILGPIQHGYNPKVNNLMHAYPHASHEHFLISDSNVRVAPDYIRDLMQHLQQPGVGLVTSTIRGAGARTPGATLENLHLNTFVASAVFTTRVLFGRPIVIGKSMLFERRTLEQIGGFAAFVNLLAEDQLIGEGIRGLGLRVVTTPRPIDNVNVSWTFSQLFSRHVRWGQIRKNLSPARYMLEVAAHPIALSLIYALVRHEADGFSVCAMVMLYKIAVDMVVGRLMRSDLRWRDYLLVPIKDLIMAAAWAVPFFKRKVNWRGNDLTIGRNTSLSTAVRGGV